MSKNTAQRHTCGSMLHVNGHGGCSRPEADPEKKSKATATEGLLAERVEAQDAGMEKTNDGQKSLSLAADEKQARKGEMF
jgi:hypothetical protein